MTSAESSTLDSNLNENTTNIRAINKDAVHKICSGQVVLSLAIAVKELVENALDAGATTVEIRLKEYGSEAIEVIDNGSGVEECNFQALTLKHHTSKLKEFSELSMISTLGFRGEALSSLCALSNLCIVTRHKSAEIATRIQYDHNGHIKSKTLCARLVGTSVTISNLFSSLPVRHKEFSKNIKREFSKMCNLLYAYCIVVKGIRIICTNQLKKGTRTTVMSTTGSVSVRDNIISIFGTKQLDTLIDFIQHEPSENILEEFSIKTLPGDIVPFIITGLISKCTHGSGRNASDRQFYYINSRPCEPTKLMKTVNEVYKHFNSHQFPFIFLNITTEQSQIDVNVTPDKRQVFLEKEKLLLATVKTSLLEMFKEYPSTYKLQNLNVTVDKHNESNVSDMLKKFGQNNESLTNTQGIKRSAKTSPKLKGVMAHFYDKRIKVAENFSQDLSENSSDDETSQIKTEESDSDGDEVVGSEKKINLSKELSGSVMEFHKVKEESTHKITIQEPKTAERKIVCGTRKEYSKVIDGKDNSQTETDDMNIKIDTDAPIKFTNEKIIDTSVDTIEDLLKDQSQKLKKEQAVIKFRSELTDRNAEKELQKQISKEMFEKMTIIGQFNKAFIIAKLDSDLFIIDQHATDEKYNFEMLQQTTVLENQKLVNPKPLELTAANECILIENLEIFQKNGFSFDIDENAEPRHKVSLTAIPVSKNYQFGKEDIDELLFMLQEDIISTSVRPSRVRDMFASRACRKSVMVGSALSKTDMRKLVDHMGQIDQPWNCPHGRPTMRHLINLDMIVEK